MKSLRFLLLAALLIQGNTVSPVLAADVFVLANARVYTVDADRSWAEAVAINPAGVIAGVGSTKDVLAAFPDADVVDLKRRMVLPGFQDVHLHAVEAGISASFCEMPQFGDAATFEAALGECAVHRDGGEWIMGAGVNMTGLLDSVADPLALIDAAVPDRPAVIIDDIGHGAWANSRALAAAGFDRLTEDPAGGLLVRGADGQLSGVVLESLSQTLVDMAQQPTDANLAFAYESLAGAMKVLSANGITTVSDAGGYWPRGHETVWKMAERNGILSVRSSNALYVYPDKPVAQQLSELTRRLIRDPDALVRFDQAKIYVDGILTQATGALYAPYAAGLELAPGDQLGFDYFPRETLFRYARALSAAGFQLHFHATGDRGVGLALDAIAAADPASGPHRITHLYLVDPKDRPRFAALGVVADFQISPSSIEPTYLNFLTSFIGDRAASILPLRALVDSGALVTLSSDWDADELSPLIKLQTVLTRRRQAAPDLATAIEMMTINPAKLLRHADRTGSIEPGKLADLAILDRALFEVEPASIGEANVVATIFQGAVVFDSEGLFSK